MINGKNVKEDTKMLSESHTSEFQEAEKKKCSTVKSRFNWHSLDLAIVPSEWYDIKGC